MKIILISPNQWPEFDPKLWFSREESALKQCRGDKVVLVSHGAPEKKAAHALLRIDLHALLIAQSIDAVDIIRLRQVRTWLPDRRVYGLLQGWTQLGTTQKAKILDFLRSDQLVPDDVEIQHLLGLNQPTRTLAARVAVELALQEVGEAVPLARLLAPALALLDDLPTHGRAVRQLREAAETHSSDQVRAALKEARESLKEAQKSPKESDL